MFDTLKKISKRLTGTEIATRSSDPDFYGALNFLPDPDPILRKLGKDRSIFNAIERDAHVISDLKAIRAGIFEYKHRVIKGGDNPSDIAAFELITKIMQSKPNNGMSWSDTIWNIAKAEQRGLSVHEIVWKNEGNVFVPTKIIDRPEQRFVFSQENNLRLLTKTNRLEGDPLNSNNWLVARHMPSFNNPYGIALFSSCFWPYTFKHSGFKYFVKFCEKYGVPWAIGKYPAGTSDKQINALAESLQMMVEDAVAAIPDNGSVELIESSGASAAHQENLINLCNREMSKALTSQAMSSEIQSTGSNRAASQTGRDKEKDGYKSTRRLIEETFNDLFATITHINFADAVPPTFEFYNEAEAQLEWIETLERGKNFMEIPTKFAHEITKIPQPEKGEDVLPKTITQMPEFNQGCVHCADFANAGDSDLDKLINQAINEADTAIEVNIDFIKQLLIKHEKEGKSLDEFFTTLESLYPKIDQDKLREVSENAMSAAQLSGVDDA